MRLFLLHTTPQVRRHSPRQQPSSYESNVRSGSVRDPSKPASTTGLSWPPCMRSSGRCPTGSGAVRERCLICAAGIPAFSGRRYAWLYAHVSAASGESAKTTLDVYGHLWPDSDDSTRAAISDVITARVSGSADYRGSNPVKSLQLQSLISRCRSRARTRAAWDAVPRAGSRSRTCSRSTSRSGPA